MVEIYLIELESKDDNFQGSVIFSPELSYSFFFCILDKNSSRHFSPDYITAWATSP